MIGYEKSAQSFLAWSFSESGTSRPKSRDIPTQIPGHPDPNPGTSRPLRVYNNRNRPLAGSSKCRFVLLLKGQFRDRCIWALFLKAFGPLISLMSWEWTNRNAANRHLELPGTCRKFLSGISWRLGPWCPRNIPPKNFMFRPLFRSPEDPAIY